ncbi:SpoIIE family protein phosphatase [Streptomyces sp. SL13]|uniref:SpoIIE family protein phosphatase n=1 Tax=Streptantibioticus silvisoli TaxID=2705255 RepID=A0AA90KJ27_9ACTN|nr:PP2C family protein-serine/threonine phosphatase [Streptantibioticus silvisoli]MDI5974070.1 SpoIIE family protein phosphatase [Streptantibioticus silvisoli]
MSLGLFEAITKALPTAVLLCAADGTVLAANPAATRAAAQLTAGTSLLEHTHGDPQALRAALAGWLRSGTPLPGALVLKDGRGTVVRFRCQGARASWWTGPGPAVQLNLHRLDQGDRFVALNQQVAALNREVAYRRTAEAQRERLLAAEQAARHRLQDLYQLTAALAAAVTLDQVADAVQTAAPATLGAERVDMRLHAQRLIPDLGPHDRTPAPGTPAWTNLDTASATGAPRRQVPAPPGTFRVRLTFQQTVLGVLDVRHPAHTAPAEPDHVRAVAQQIAQAVRRAGLYEHEHRLAERLQLSLLPRLPPVTSLETATCYAPGSDLLQVGGDWYDLYDLDENHVALSIGDVAGHGLPEAAVMARTTAALRAIVQRCGHHPAQVMDRLNAFLHQHHHGAMATACYLLHHLPTRTLTYVKAGHPPPLLITPDSGSRYLNGPISPPVGPIEKARYREGRTTWRASETLLLYTDGLIERRGESLDTGLDHLARAPRDGMGLSLRDLCQHLLNHRPHTHYPDDRALLLARPRPTGSSSP